MGVVGGQVLEDGIVFVVDGQQVGIMCLYCIYQQLVGDYQSFFVGQQDFFVGMCGGQCGGQFCGIDDGCYDYVVVVG